MTYSLRDIVIAVSAVIVTVGIIGYAITAKADISNPHPIPPSNSVTAAMLQSGIITDAAVSETAGIGATKLGSSLDAQLIYFGGASTFSTSTALRYLSASGGIYATQLGISSASTTINGLTYAWPSSHGASGNVLTNNGSGTITWSSPVSSKTTLTYTTLEAVTQGDMLAATTTASSKTFPGGAYRTNGNTFSADAWYAYSTTTPSGYPYLLDTTIHWNDTIGGSVAASFDVYVKSDNAGVPGSTVFGQASTSASTVNGNNSKLVSFGSTLNVGASTVIWVVVKYTGASATQEAPELTTGTTPVSLFGTNGTSWSSATTQARGDFDLAGTGVTAVAEASGAASNWRCTGALGMAESTVAANGTVTLDTTGLSSATTTSATSTAYFLSNTNGAVSTSAGSCSQKVGTGFGAGGFMVRIPS